MSHDQRGIAARRGSLRTGVTLTPALDKIPRNDKLVSQAAERNPSSRLTIAEDVAKAMNLLVYSRADRITGNVIRVDGGEDIVG